MKLSIVILFINVFSFQALSSDSQSLNSGFQEPRGDKTHTKKKKKGFTISTKRHIFSTSTKKTREPLPPTSHTYFSPITTTFDPSRAITITPPIFTGKKIKAIQLRSLKNQLDSIFNLFDLLLKNTTILDQDAEETTKQIIYAINLNPDILDTASIDGKPIIPLRSRIEKAIEREKCDPSPVSVDQIFQIEEEDEDFYPKEGSFLLEQLEKIKADTF
jgi:hypothetical protein